MRRLPTKLTKKQKLILAVAEDFFGDPNLEEKKSIKKIALWIFGRKKGLRRLTEEERKALWYIRNNLADKVYVSSFESDIK